jgi:hypothetical protein
VAWLPFAGASEVLGAAASLSIDGKPVGQLKDIKVAGQYSAITGYGLQIGRNTSTPVSHSYAVPFAFTGKLDNVTIDMPPMKKTMNERNPGTMNHIFS